ncbi:hypothetical protein [Campylobacter fetus]|uniref:Uncharacterized protein n=1 Tax=Campylobacter fetus subsp. testudinum TaxID=1507806 RepID=A0AAX0HBV1_CAMFE|nr:hypothetical protein [Campylobacter fetus]AGZ81201.1 hypothetical protein CFT03427_0313 [Campylobacter fetus subsp. testudinum 03-427]AJB44957.1 hypothetical protein CR44_01575 [Campylobacter fetus subsp. testudinum]AVK80579.1 hypothetical protein C6B32_01595 [Campylobacter fetus subsp. testudinum]EAI4321601.1 hypothetical protein [Campylobacter fetus]EAI4391455.1 hypothetical protein [Campylobacter fetus]
MRFILFVIIVVNISFARYCSSPIYPTCLNVPYGMVDSYRQVYGLTCKNSLMHYLDELERYNKCLSEDIAEAYSNSIKVYNCIYAGQCD